MNSPSTKELAHNHSELSSLSWTHFPHRLAPQTHSITIRLETYMLAKTDRHDGSPHRKQQSRCHSFLLIQRPSRKRESPQPWICAKTIGTDSAKEDQPRK